MSQLKSFNVLFCLLKTAEMYKTPKDNLVSYTEELQKSVCFKVSKFVLNISFSPLSFYTADIKLNCCVLGNVH